MDQLPSWSTMPARSRAVHFAKLDPAVFGAMWNVHVMGAVHATRAMLPGMVERGFGRIVNIASTAGLKGYAYVSAYCAAKHALVGLTRALALECATRGSHRERGLPRLYRY